LRVAEHLKGMNRIRFLAQARDDFLAAADRIGIADGAARRLANRLGLLAVQNPKPKVEVEGTEEGNTKAERLQRKLDELTGSYRSNVVVDDRQAHAAINGIRSALNSLTANPWNFIIHGTRTGASTAAPTGGPHGMFATADGGLIRGPGGPRDDLIQRWLSNGEYVVKSAAVDKYGIAMFDRLNSMSYTSAPAPAAYAGDGRGSAEIARLAQTVDQLTQQLASLGSEVRAGARDGTQVGAHAGTRAGMDANNRGGYMQRGF